MAHPTTSPGAPDRERLETTVARVISRLNPDQVVLFGSAARDEMTVESDIDLLVIKERGGGEPTTQRERWEPENGTGYEADVILMDRATAEAGRNSITRIQGAALEEGRTLYTRRDVAPIPTGPAYVWNGREMVKKTKFEPEEATRLLGHAEEHWRFAQDAETTSSMRCIQLQASMEHALKALSIALGERVRHKHTLNELWDDVEGHGEDIGATRDRKASGRADPVRRQVAVRKPYKGNRPERHMDRHENDGRRPVEPCQNVPKVPRPRLIIREPSGPYSADGEVDRFLDLARRQLEIDALVADDAADHRADRLLIDDGVGQDAPYGLLHGQAVASRPDLQPPNDLAVQAAYAQARQGAAPLLLRKC